MQPGPHTPEAANASPAALADPDVAAAAAGATPTFARFLARLDATGPARDEGFDRSHFDGLADDERPVVRALLVQAVRGGDPTAIYGLLAFDPDTAPAVLDALVAEHPFPDDVGLTVAAALWERGGDPRHAAAILPYVRHPSAGSRLLALYFLQTAPCTLALRRALATAVRDDESDPNRSYAASKLLACAGVVARPGDAHREQGALMDALTAADRNVRRAALARLAVPTDAPDAPEHPAAPADGSAERPLVFALEAAAAAAPLAARFHLARVPLGPSASAGSRLLLAGRRGVLHRGRHYGVLLTPGAGDVEVGYVETGARGDARVVGITAFLTAARFDAAGGDRPTDPADPVRDRLGATLAGLEHRCADILRGDRAWIDALRARDPARWRGEPAPARVALALRVGFLGEDRAPAPAPHGA